MSDSMLLVVILVSVLVLQHYLIMRRRPAEPCKAVINQGCVLV